MGDSDSSAPPGATLRAQPTRGATRGAEAEAGRGPEAEVERAPGVEAGRNPETEAGGGPEPKAEAESARGTEAGDDGGNCSSLHLGRPRG